MNAHVSHHEAVARDRKVEKLLAVLERAARAAGIERLTVDHLIDQDWRRVAMIAGVPAPSHKTVAALLDRVRRRAA